MSFVVDVADEAGLVVAASAPDLAALGLLLAGAVDAAAWAGDGPALLPGALEIPHAERASTPRLTNAVKDGFIVTPFPYKP
ncbi:MAG TPA: hypothetical protein VIR57_02405 [Chloroflexota bacterium]